MNRYDIVIALLKYNQGLGHVTQHGFEADWDMSAKVFQQK